MALTQTMEWEITSSLKPFLAIGPHLVGESVWVEARGRRLHGTFVRVDPSGRTELRLIDPKGEIPI